MTLSEAKSFIQNAFSKGVEYPTTWVDLGCGSGVFTEALAELLSHSSRIIAVDREPQTFNFVGKDVDVEFIQSDMEHDDFPFDQVDGIIMANSLHYIKDQKSFLNKIKNSLSQKGRIILIEYDTESSNQWVPYPINFNKAVRLFTESGFKEVVKIGERQSVYRKDKMYACLIR